MKLKTLCSACLVAMLAHVPAASAFIIAGQLTGDPRVGNPDNLIVDVTINVTGDTAQWTIDLNSPAHPNIKLDEFYFNLTGAASDYSFSAFSPADWAVSTPASSAGGGNISFLFEALDPAGPPNAADVTNAVPLTFTMTYSGVGDLTANHFLLAASNCSNDVVLGCGQMGAHLQSLTAGVGESDSGFALGDYEDRPSEVPEPASLALLGLGLAGIGLMRRRRA